MVERHFLGWNGPTLPRAARWLVKRYGPAMGGVTVVLPAGRAARRLLELLTREMAPREASAAAASPSGGGVAWEPPTLLTLGELPEALYDEAGEGLAGELEAMAARVHTLRTAESGVLAPVVPHPPGRGDVAGWWGLAETLRGLGEELAAGRLGVGDVPRLAAERGIDLGLGEARWAALAALEERYRAVLSRPDVQSARAAALRAGRCKAAGPVVLVGVVDPTRQAAAMLEQAAEHGEVHALVHAPAEHAAGFDAVGQLVVDYWHDRQSGPEQGVDVRWVDRPGDEAVAVVQRLGELHDAAGGDVAADEVTVGLGDEGRAGGIERAVELAGTPARFGGGTPALRSGPARLLDALAAYLGGGRSDSLAALVRHPDLVGVLGEEVDWLTALDRHVSAYLDADVSQPARDDAGGPGRERVEMLRERLATLVPDDADHPRPLPTWSGPILALLDTIYGHRTLDRRRDHALIASLQHLTRLLREQAELDPDAATTPRVNLADALRLTLRRLAGTDLPPPGGTVAVELVGYLELALDDAPHLIVTGMNEGHVPASRTADAFLPDALRSALGLPDNTRRLARDRLLLTTMLHSRTTVTLTACRTSNEGDPLAPSRLLLSGDDVTLAARLSSFYEVEPSEAPRPRLLAPGRINRFIVPRPTLDHPPITRLSATRFKAYLACPYRFYLADVLKLDAMDDRAVELNPLAFGNLAHTVLQRFAESDDADATRPEVIEARLNRLLDEAVAQRVGPGSRVAVRVQVEQLRERLQRFAEQQADEARKGWRICRDRIEQGYEATVEVDGEPFTLTGRIDRIDRHPDLGYRLLDYKTAEGGDDPHRTHRRGERWVDLQLPVYLDLVRPTGIDRAELGYFNLAKSVKDSGVKPVTWNEDDLGDAATTRDEVIRGLRAQRFWPPSDDLPQWDDPFVRVAADRAVDRPDLIRGGA